MNNVLLINVLPTGWQGAANSSLSLYAILFSGLPGLVQNLQRNSTPA
ncbi:hypothetical protein [Bacteroides helcogenes]|nr:hypothetical protein [Bacteroides helcogenes]MDY5239147.1 hypothetical protein [Bacteroides helcogenes]